MAGVERWVSSQPQYSMLWRKPEAELIALCEREQISQIVWSPLAQGVLTGKYLPGEPPPADSRAASDSMSGFIDRLIAPPVLEAVQRLKPIAERAGLTLAQLALAWVLRQANVASAIVGASRPEQVHANASASGIELDDGHARGDRRRARRRQRALSGRRRRAGAPRACRGRRAQRACTTSV